MALMWSVDQTLLVSAVPTVLAAAAVGGLGRIQGRRIKQVQASGGRLQVRHPPSDPLDKKA
jgi:AAHS family 4-hydroxybenzoate transporter-like MFS transporter